MEDYESHFAITGSFDDLIELLKEKLKNSKNQDFQIYFGDNESKNNEDIYNFYFIDLRYGGFNYVCTDTWIKEKIKKGSI